MIQVVNGRSMRCRQLRHKGRTKLPPTIAVIKCLVSVDTGGVVQYTNPTSSASKSHSQKTHLIPTPATAISAYVRESIPPLSFSIRIYILLVHLKQPPKIETSHCPGQGARYIGVDDRGRAVLRSPTLA